MSMTRIKQNRAIALLTALLLAVTALIALAPKGTGVNAAGIDAPYVEFIESIDTTMVMAAGNAGPLTLAQYRARTRNPMGNLANAFQHQVSTGVPDWGSVTAVQAVKLDGGARPPSYNWTVTPTLKDGYDPSKLLYIMFVSGWDWFLDVLLAGPDRIGRCKGDGEMGGSYSVGPTTTLLFLYYGALPASAPAQPPVLPATTALNLSMVPGINESVLNFTWQTAELHATKLQFVKMDGILGPHIPPVPFPEAQAHTFTGSCTRQVLGYAANGDVLVNHINRVYLSGLEPSTGYFYRVSTGASTWSDTYYFITRDTEEYSFLVVTDPHVATTSSGTDWANTLARALTKTPNLSFALCAGDQTNESWGNQAEYDNFFSAATLKNLPLAPAIGNHDSREFLYGRHFTLPNEHLTAGKVEAGSDYWFSYGNMLVMVLVGDAASTTAQQTAHRAFMQEAVNANPNAQWRVVLVHQSIYGAGTQYSQEAGTLTQRAILAPLMDEFKVDAVFSGHEHCFSRSYFMNYKNKDAAPGADKSQIVPPLTAVSPGLVVPAGAVIKPDGTLYVTSSSARSSDSRPVYAPPNDWTAKSLGNTPTFTAVNVTRTSFEVVTYNAVTSAEIDRFMMVKPDGVTVTPSETPNAPSVTPGLPSATPEPSTATPGTPDPTPDVTPAAPIRLGDANLDSNINIFDILDVRDHIFAVPGKVLAVGSRAFISADVAEEFGVLNIFDILGIRDIIFKTFDYDGYYELVAK